MTGAPATLLLVEDDPGHARLIEKNIRRGGATNPIVHVRDGASALAQLAALAGARTDEGAPRLVMLLDMNLPDMSGTDLLARVKADPGFRRLPVLVLTTSDDRTEIGRCYELGCSLYITKPLAYERFAEAVCQIGRMVSVMEIPDCAGAR